MDGTFVRVRLYKSTPTGREEFLTRHPEWSQDTAESVIKEEIGLVFEKVLECAGVYKVYSEEQRKAQTVSDNAGITITFL